MGINFEDRFILPENTWLVLFIPPSVPLMTSESCRFMDFFANKKNAIKLSQPMKYKTEIQNQFEEVRIYGPGDSIPSISTTLLNNHMEHGECMKSGLYKYPHLPHVNRKLFPVPSTDHPIHHLIQQQKEDDFLPQYMTHLLRCYKYSVFVNPSKDTKLTHVQYEEIYRGSLIKPGYLNHKKMS